MDSQYLYLTLDIGTISVPLIFSFYPDSPFYKKWKFLFPSIIITAIVFILWDEFFTQLGVWGFNQRYVGEATLGNLPLEEILFFICIPYACVFTYEALNHFIKRDIFSTFTRPLGWMLTVLLFVIGAIHYSKAYTSVTFIALSIFLGILLSLKVSFLGRFFLAYLVILIPFFIVNGILTGTGIEQQVVWYNNDENLGIRLGTIPVEDIFYGMLLILMNVSLFEYLQRRSISRQH